MLGSGFRVRVRVRIRVRMLGLGQGFMIRAILVGLGPEY